MSDRQIKRSESLKIADSYTENSRICSFSIESLLAPNNKNQDENKYPRQTDTSSPRQESKPCNDVHFKLL